MLLKTFLPISVAGLLLTACVSQQSVSEVSAEPERKKVEMVEVADRSAVTNVNTLDEELLYTYLAGEIAAQRGQLDFAYENYIQAARSVRDIYAAKRATQIALYLKQDSRALTAANLWLTYDPDSIQARNTAAVLNMRAGYEDQALQHLKHMQRLAEAESKDGFMTAALSLSKEERQSAAVSLMQRLSEAFPQNYQAYNALGVLQAAFKLYDQAIISLKSSIALRPEVIEPKLLVVRILVEQDKSAEAQAYIEKILPQHPDDFDLGLIYAKLLVSVDHRRSYEAFLKLNDIKPDDPDVLAALGILAVQLDDIKAARNWWQKLLAVGDRQQRGDAAFQLGQLAELAGKNEEAVSFYSLVNHGTYRLDARLRLARIKAERGEIGKARDLMRQLRVLQPERVVDYYIAEGQLLQQHAQQQEVLDFYSQALIHKAEDRDLLYARGLYASDIGMVDLAEQDFRKVLTLEPGSADALNALGYTLADQTERYQEAFDLISKAYAIKPDNAAILDSMGWVHYRMGNFDQALTFLRKAFEKSQDDEIASHLGEVLWVTGNRGQAKEIWDKALVDYPDSRKITEARQRLEK